MARTSDYYALYFQYARIGLSRLVVEINTLREEGFPDKTEDELYQKATELRLYKTALSEPQVNLLTDRETDTIIDRIVELIHGLDIEIAETSAIRTSYNSGVSSATSIFASATTFASLSDTFSNYSARTGQYLKVNGNGDAITTSAIAQADVTGLVTFVSDTNTTLGTLDTRLDTAEGDINDLETWQTSATQDLIDLQADIDDTDVIVNSLVTDVDTLVDGQTVLELAVDDINTDLLTVLHDTDLATSVEVHEGTSTSKVITPNALSESASLQTQFKGFLSGTFDFTILGGALGTYYLRTTGQATTISIPARAVISRAYAYMELNFVAAGDSLISIGVESGSSTALMAATNANTLTTGWKALIPDGTIANFTAATLIPKRITFTIADIPITSGKMQVYIEYFTTA